MGARLTQKQTCSAERVGIRFWRKSQRVLESGILLSQRSYSIHWLGWRS